MQHIRDVYGDKYTNQIEQDILLSQSNLSQKETTIVYYITTYMVNMSTKNYYDEHYIVDWFNKIDEFQLKVNDPNATKYFRIVRGRLFCMYAYLQSKGTIMLNSEDSDDSCDGRPNEDGFGPKMGSEDRLVDHIMVTMHKCLNTGLNVGRAIAKDPISTALAVDAGVRIGMEVGAGVGEVPGAIVGGIIGGTYTGMHYIESNMNNGGPEGRINQVNTVDGRSGADEKWDHRNQK